MRWWRYFLFFALPCSLWFHDFIVDTQSAHSDGKKKVQTKSEIYGFCLPFKFMLCAILFWFSPDPVCQHWGQTRIQQVPYQGRPPLPLSVHLAVLHRQLQLRYCTPESFIPLPWDVETPTVFLQTDSNYKWLLLRLKISVMFIVKFCFVSLKSWMMNFMYIFLVLISCFVIKYVHPSTIAVHIWAYIFA